MEAALRGRLSGVRRAGKTFLSQSLRDIEYFDCELPRVRRMIDDPEDSSRVIRGRRIVLDEIHRCGHRRFVKIAADHFPSSSYRPDNDLLVEALTEAREVFYDQTPTRVMRAEHLVAIASGATRIANACRLLREQAGLDRITSRPFSTRHRLEEK